MAENSERGTLQFLDSFTIEQFKVAQHVDKIQIRQNPRTTRIFFTYGAKVGAVASAGIPAQPMISYVKGDPTPENPSGEFYLLHEEGKGAPVLATF